MIALGTHVDPPFSLFLALQTGLYSVLVEGLPNRPRQAISEEDLEAAMSDPSTDGEKMDWQLSVTSAFFDYCVPNQPGFSSSVAAVTILPSASELALAWKKWYRATKKLSRLRFIRRQLLERAEQDNEGNEEEIVEIPHNTSDNHNNNTHSQQNGYPEPLTSLNSGSTDRARAEDNGFEVYLGTAQRRSRYTNEILGEITDDDVEAMFLDALEMGPEQTAVYSMELAKGSSRCCPHGCCEEKILWSSIEELKEMEKEAVLKAQEAFVDLELTREKTALAHETREEKPKFGDRFHLDKAATHVVSDDKSMEERLYEHRLSTSRHHRETGTQENTPQTSIRAQHDVEEVEAPASTTNFSSRVEPSQPLSQQRRKSDFNGGKAHDPATLRTLLDREHSAYFPSMPRLVAKRGSATIPTTNSNVSTLELDALWEDVKTVATECTKNAKSDTNQHRVSDGVWSLPSPKMVLLELWANTKSMLAWTVKTSGEAIDLQARDTSLAVVTFTSRQAAIAARKCLADGRGAGRWRTLQDVPVPPLADASAFDICDCRGCCRPVTVTLNEHQKIWRNYL